MWSLVKAKYGWPSGEDGVGDGVEFWTNPERKGWMKKQGEYIKTWRRRWFVLKQGKIFWFKYPVVNSASVPLGVISLASFLSVKSAEEVINGPFAFELSSRTETLYFIADTEREMRGWTSSIGRSIVQHSRSIIDAEIVDYDTNQHPPS